VIARTSAPERQPYHDAAAAAWAAAEYERCLQLCSAAQTDGAARVNHAVLRARALLRLGRHADVARGLNALLSHEDLDVRLTVRGLIGVARVRSGDASALSLLQAALADAATASIGVRSEMAINVALAYYAQGDYAAADASLDLVAPNTDIVYARALEFRGWTALARGDQERATAWFMKELDTHDRCNERDRYMEVNCTQALAALALERFDWTAWAVVARRRARLEWSASSLQEHRMFVAMRAAVWAYDVEGDPQQAAWEARCAEEWAPSEAFRVQALCCRAAVARKAREPISQRNHVEVAYRLFNGLRRPLGRGDESMVPLVLAEELANAGRAGDAREMLEVFRTRSISPVISMSHDPRVAGFERLVEGQVFEAEGSFSEAIAAFREAFEFFSGTGSLRRSLTAAVRLLRLSPDDTYLWQHVDLVVARTAKGSWIVSLADGLRRAHAARRLTAVQRAYLRLLCDGKSNPEIARLRMRSVNTVRNQVATLFETFDVQSRAELVAQCARLGILDSGAD